MPEGSMNMLVRYLGGALLGVGAGGAAVWAIITHSDRKQESIAVPAPAGVPGHSQHCLKYGLPTLDNLRFHRGFVASFDSRMRNPRWVLEHLTQKSSSGGASRKNEEFFEDAGIETRFRNRLADFKASGYDRGHLAPAANHKGDQAALAETFSLSNISPQVGKGFNRDYWARFERFVKQLVDASDDVYIVTGPLYVPQRTPQGQYVLQHPMIGTPPCLTAVPTHFYKVVLAERASRPWGSGRCTAAVGAFVMPNAQIMPDMPLAAFAVPLDVLESVAGHSFFPGYISPARRQVHDAAAYRWNAVGQQQKRSMKFPDPAARQQSGLLLLGGPAAVPALPGPGAAPVRRPGGTGGEGGAVQKASGAAEGLVHLCDVVECRLPAEDWYLSNKPTRKPLDNPGARLAGPKLR